MLYSLVYCTCLYQTLVLDVAPPTLDLVLDACASAIVNVQRENLLNTFHGSSSEELLVLVKVTTAISS